MINNFLLAIQFLTIIPLKISGINDKKIAKSVIFFPIVGLLLGVFLIAINRSLSFLNLSPLVASTILIIALVVTTGGIHSDGLADTTDALLSAKSKDEMLTVMRDPHIGTMGVLGLLSIILLKIGFLSSISSPDMPATLLLMCLLSRWTLVLSMFLFPYARATGKAGMFISGMTPKIFTISTTITLICAFFIGQKKGVLIFLAVAAFVYFSGKFFKKKIGGITGDTLGAVSEVSETLILFLVIILERMPL